MKRRAIVTHTRPNTSVAFYEVPETDKADWDALFASGALISKETIMTPLQVQFINTWRSAADASAFAADPKSIARHQGVEIYNTINGIVKTLQFEDVPD